MAFTVVSRDLADGQDSGHLLSHIYDTDWRILSDGLAGVGVVSGCTVTAQGSPDMTVAIAAGTIRIASGALVAVAAGNGTIGAASGSNPRIDLISASNAGVKTVTAGTAAANPKPPDLPAGNVALAYVLVPTSDTTISTGQIVDKRVILPSPLTELAYAERTSNLSVTATTDATAQTIVTASAVICDGVNAIEVYLSIAYAKPQSTVSNFVVFSLYEDGSSLGGMGLIQTPASGALNIPVYIMKRLIPSAGSHTYSWRAWVGAGTGTVTAGAGGVGVDAPAYIHIKRA